MRISKAFLFSLLAVLIATPGFAGEGAVRPDPVRPDPRQVAWKQAHIAKVVAELRAREPADLTPAQREARLRNIERLAVYGKTGVFPINDKFPGLAIPYLIDGKGTRCALAHLIDRSGHRDFLLTLAQDHNNAFLPELAEDARLHAWLTAEGLTLEDAAFIQGPGFVDPQLRDATPEGETTPTGTPDGGPTTPRAPGTRPSRRATAAPAMSWDSWWNLNRHAFLNLREAYHTVVQTGDADPTVRPHRPSDDDVTRIVLPMLREQSDPKQDTRATALMAWARAAQGHDDAALIPAVLEYLGSKDATYRDMLVLALGVSGNPAGYEPLVELVQDTKVGRRIVRSTQSLSDRVRGFAAIALGALGDARGIAVLMEVMAKDKRGAADLRSCCVAALGVLTTRATPVDRARVHSSLAGALTQRTWPDEVLATVPTALAISKSVMAPQLVEHIARFRKPAAARQSAALALPVSESTLTPALADTLIATVRRDPDDMSRRFALLALGQLASTASDDEAVRTKLHRFFDAAFRGVHVGTFDRPWVHVAAGLFARACPEDARGKVPAALRHAMAKGASPDDRASAVIGLALIGRADVVPELRKQLARSGHDRFRGYLAEALGILRDRDSRDKLLRMVTSDKSDHVRYHAAMGLGFLADRSVVPELVKALGTVHSFNVKAAITRVIGEIGDKRALIPLMDMARDTKADTWTRRRALAALGMIAENNDHAWTTRFRRSANMQYATPTLRQVLAIF